MEDQKQEALRLYNGGASLRDIAGQFNVSHQTISNWISPYLEPLPEKESGMDDGDKISIRISEDALKKIRVLLKSGRYLNWANWLARLVVEVPGDSLDEKSHYIYAHPVAIPHCEKYQSRLVSRQLYADLTYLKSRVQYDSYSDLIYALVTLYTDSVKFRSNATNEG